MFEAVHGSAPDIAGKSIANPSGLLNAGILMLRHIGQGDVAEKIENAWLKTIEDGVHTADIAKKGTNAVSTSEFADAVIANLGGKPSTLPEAVNAGAKSVKLPSPQETTKSVRTKQWVGVDVLPSSFNINKSIKEIDQQVEKEEKEKEKDNDNNKEHDSNGNVVVDMKLLKLAAQEYMEAEERRRPATSMFL